MIRTLVVVAAIIGLVILVTAEGAPPRAAADRSPPAVVGGAGLDVTGRVPLRFEANRGQTDPSVAFICRADGGRIFIGADEAVMVGRGAAVTMKLLGASPAARVVGAEELPGHTNYLKGNDRSRWVTGVPGYRRVVSEAVYPGIDIGYRGHGRSLEYDFIVAPGADPGGIRLGFEGADLLEVDAEGNLMIQVGGGAILHRAPRVYQEIGGEQVEVAGCFVLLGDFEVGFEVAEYDTKQTLVVDPEIVFSTFLGGTPGPAPDPEGDIVQAIAVDAQGCVYVTGYTYSADFPTTASLGPVYYGDLDAFVTKLSTDGSALIYSTYIGGSTPSANFDRADDNGLGLVLDGTQVCLAGLTTSDDFPTTLGAYDEDHNGHVDAFVLILNALGNGLVYGTLFGGPGYDYAHDLDTDPSGRLYFAGGSESPDLATQGAFSESPVGGMDVLFAVIDPAAGGNADLHYATYLGAAYTDRGWKIAVDQSFDPDGQPDAYIVGDSTNRKKVPQFPTTPNAFLPKMRITTTIIPSPYLSRISPEGNGSADLVYSTFFKNPDTIEYLQDVALDGTGRAYVTGYTASNKWPTTPGAFSTSNTGHVDAVVTVIDTDVSGEEGLVYSTYIGGSEQDNGSAIALDSAGNIYVTGWTSQDYPGEPDPTPFPTTPDAFETTPTLFDVFLMKLYPGGAGAADLIFSTLIGGEDDETGMAITVVEPNDVYLAGHTFSAGFPTTSGAFDETHNGGTDAFVMQVSLASEPVPPAAPSALVATAASSSAIDLNWTDNAGNEDGFEVGRLEGASWQQIATLGPNTTSWTDTGLEAQTAYSYRVLAFNTFGASAYSNVASATTLPPPVGVNVDTITPNSMNVGTTISVTITGSGFATGAAVSFESGQGPAPSTSNVNVVSGSEITCTLSVSSGGPPGTRVWDVRVANPDLSTGVLIDGFSVVK